MRFLTSFRLAAGVLALAAFSLTTGCTPPAPHPDQLNSFDGAAYDSLTLAHGALTSLRQSISSEYPTYSHAFNDAAAAYNQTINTYGTYRITREELGIDSDLRSLTVALVTLETSLASEFHTTSKQSATVRASARQIRAQATKAHVQVSDILTELEIAMALAQAVPSTNEYARLAQVVVNATSSALAAQGNTAGKPINLQNIPAIQLIP